MKYIFYYELKLLLRDKKSLFFIFILPLIMFPLINGSLRYVSKSRVKNVLSDTTSIACLEDSVLEGYCESLHDSLYNISFLDTSINYSKDTILSKYDCLITRKDSGSIDLINIFYDGKSEKSSIRINRLFKDLEKLRHNIVLVRYSKIGIENIDTTRHVKEINIASNVKTKNKKHATKMPITLVIILLISNYMLANFVILGEKDNKTLETLISSGVSRYEIVYGKLALILISGILLAFLELISFYLYGKFGGMLSMDLSITPSQFILFSIIVTILAIQIASFSTYISCILKSATAGNIVFLPIMLIFVLLSIAGVLPIIVMEKGLILIPIFNCTNLMKSIILDDYSYFNFIAVVTVSIFYSIWFIRLSVKYLSSEKIFDYQSISKSEPGKDIGFLMIVYAFIISLYFQIGGYLQSLNIFWGLIASQLIFLAFGSIFILKIKGYDIKNSLSLRKAHAIYFIFAILLGIFLRFPISLIKEYFDILLPLPKILQEGGASLDIMKKLGLGKGLLIIALLPAICEEMLFRGALMSFIRKNYTAWKISLIIGVLFGIMHLNVYTMLETSIMGFFLTYLAIASGSIFPSVLMHFINNGVSVILVSIFNNNEVNQEWINNYIFNNQHLVYLISLVLIILFFLTKKYWRVNSCTFNKREN